MILGAMERLGVADAGAVAVVGDTTSDLEAGTNAGARAVIGVLSGAHDRTTLSAAPHTDLIDDVTGLIEVLTATDRNPTTTRARSPRPKPSPRNRPRSQRKETTNEDPPARRAHQCRRAHRRRRPHRHRAVHRGSGRQPVEGDVGCRIRGMSGLVKAAKKEGTLNVITLPADWANYGNIIKDFSKKYGIKINSENPDGTSADEIDAVTTEKGQSRAPDVLDLGTSFAISAASDGPAGPLQGAELERDPGHGQGLQRRLVRRLRRVRGHRLQLQGRQGPRRPRSPTCSSPIYKNEVALNGNPTQAGAAFAAVYAAALANGGSFSNIAPGIKYFQKLSAAGELRAGDGRRDHGRERPDARS